jgi:hypothetical protein
MPITIRSNWGIARKPQYGIAAIAVMSPKKRRYSVDAGRNLDQPAGIHVRLHEL